MGGTSFPSHIRMDLSCEPEYIQFFPPHLRHVTAAVWPDNVKIGRCWTVSQTFITVSFDAEANRQSSRPVTLLLDLRKFGDNKWSGSHASEVIHFECPLNESPFGFPVDPSHNRNYN